jgi:hypothetical protein
MRSECTCIYILRLFPLCTYAALNILSLLAFLHSCSEARECNALGIVTENCLLGRRYFCNIVGSEDLRQRDCCMASKQFMNVWWSNQKQNVVTPWPRLLN